MNSLKQAFRNEIRLDEYLAKVWITALVVALVLGGQAVFREGQIDFSYLLPTDGRWHARDRSGVFYIDTWSSMLVNSLQVGLGLWGGVLMAIGIKRAVTGNKYFWFALSLGITFILFAYFMPSLMVPLLNMLVQKMPYLAH